MKLGFRLSLGVVPLVLAVVVAAASCGGETEKKSHASGGAAGSTGNTGGLLLDSTTDDAPTSDTDAGPACGDGKIDPGEKCDDGNGVSGDGCAANCDAIEKDFACPEPGKPCVSGVKCGDGKVMGDETCDDSNTASGDGCDASCHVENGWKCPSVGIQCEAAVCGDGIVAGSEQCDDGNSPPTSGDGCDSTCKLEPGWVCEQAGKPCAATVCGDGVVEGSEQCEDGNHDLGDGCTPFCQKEPDCSAGACKSTCGDGLKLPGDTEQCEDGNTLSGDGCSPTCQIEPGYQCTDLAAAAGDTLELPIVIRDFNVAHPDFEDFFGVDLEIVDAFLKPNAKPKYKNSGGTTLTTTGESSFDQWYADMPGVNITMLQKLTLKKLASGVFQFEDSTFFPIDGQGWGNEGLVHNFHFTSEVRYWFEYKGGEQLDFTGDDDVWVFVNKQLVVDLGGVHPAMSGSVTLDAATAAGLGLQIGNIYETAVFQAERHTVDSSYKLTLSGFTRTSSVCTSVCGDGVRTPDEACDDGKNDGSYGSCTPDCKQGPYCGDGLVQAAYEECDDGLNLSPYGGCAPGCKLGGFCGDGVVDGLFGEACDDGKNDGGYGECAPGCVLGARCGDGIRQSPQEECDDGNKIEGDGCSSSCKHDGPA